MTCSGCSGAIERVLKKTEGGWFLIWALSSKCWMNGSGIKEYEVNQDKQKVNVTGTITYDTLLEKIKKTGKEVGDSRQSTKSWSR